MNDISFNAGSERASSTVEPSHMWVCFDKDLRTDELCLTRAPPGGPCPSCGSKNIDMTDPLRIRRERAPSFAEVMKDELIVKELKSLYSAIIENKDSDGSIDDWECRLADRMAEVINRWIESDRKADSILD